MIKEIKTVGIIYWITMKYKNVTHTGILYKGTLSACPSIIYTNIRKCLTYSVK